ncbi:hypothetical protein E4K67_13215 [Desulfosporosinus fructosivorans]|uniref:DUF3021 domain-containing protein n=1 Tax=Desulfosporosinus fructosivorans TaxID=2018669 RepID=A0A4Z0R7D8_9FIRM|nr:hypothetical protein E4K67_13215 [Desulfosporosinus fructosivorans]
MKKDRLVAGGIAGVLGAFSNVILGYIFKSLGWSDRSFYDYSTTLFGGFVMWMLLTSLGTMYNIPLFSDTPLDVAYTTLFTALVYGIVIAWALRTIETKSKLL